jgi:hypothetical protein
MFSLKQYSKWKSLWEKLSVIEWKKFRQNFWMTIMSKFFILLSTNNEIIIITRSLHILYCKMLKIDVLLMRDRVWVVCVERIRMRIDIDNQVVFDFLACASLDRESFDFVSRQNSYHTKYDQISRHLLREASSQFA